MMEIGRPERWVTIDATAGTRDGARLPGRRRTPDTARRARARDPATIRAGARRPPRRRRRTRPPGPPPTTTRSTRSRPRRDTPATVTTTHASPDGDPLPSIAYCH